MHSSDFEWPNMLREAEHCYVPIRKRNKRVSARGTSYSTRKQLAHELMHETADLRRTSHRLEQSGQNRPRSIYDEWLHISCRMCNGVKQTAGSGHCTNEARIELGAPHYFFFDQDQIALLRIAGPRF